MTSTFPCISAFDFHLTDYCVSLSHCIKARGLVSQLCPRMRPCWLWRSILSGVLIHHLCQISTVAHAIQRPRVTCVDLGPTCCSMLLELIPQHMRVSMLSSASSFYRVTLKQVPISTIERSTGFEARMECNLRTLNVDARLEEAMSQRPQYTS